MRTLRTIDGHTIQIDDEQKRIRALAGGTDRLTAEWRLFDDIMPYGDSGDLLIIWPAGEKPLKDHGVPSIAATVLAIDIDH